MDLKVSARDQVIIAVVVAILMVLGFIMLGLRPQFSRISELRAQQQEEEKKKQNSELTLSRLRELKKEAPKTEAALIEIKKRLPEDPQLATFLVDIQDTANQAGVDLVSLKPGDMVQQTGLSSIPFAMHISGSFFDIVDFMYRMKDLKRETRIDKINVSAKEWPALSVDVEGNTFTLAAPVQKAGSSPPSQTKEE